MAETRGHQTGSRRPNGVSSGHTGASCPVEPRRACCFAMTTSKQRATRKVMMVAAGGLAVFGLFRLGGWMLADDTETAGTEHLINQVWVDHFPRDKRDMTGHLLFVDHPEGKVGVTGRSSAWRHRVEVFLWAKENDTMLMRFPQSGAKGKVKARTWHCEGEAPEPFELCLELTSGDKSLKMYSREDWIVKPQDVEGSLADVANEVPGLATRFDAFVAANADEDEDEDESAEDASVPMLADPAMLLQ